MSTQATQPEAINAATTQVLDQVQRPIFFAKLASYGIHPSSDEEQETLWQMGSDLLQANSQAAKPEPQVNLLKQAHADLRAFLGQNVDYSGEISQQLANQNPELLKAAHLLAESLKPAA